LAERSDHACGIHVTPSNDLETLASVLASLIADEGNPLTPALVVVPNPGTGRWLMHHLATQQGIAAHIEQPLPASFFWRVLRAWLPEVEADPFDRETLAWRIQARLPDFLDKDSRFQSLTRYVSGDDREMRLFQLSRRIAEVFELDPDLISPITTAELGQQAARPANSGFDISKATNELGISMSGVLGGLRKFKAEEQEYGAKKNEKDTAEQLPMN